MIKNLFIVRHGHAAFKGEKDFDRPLTSKGVSCSHKTATYIANKCQEKNLQIDMCISSGALRTKQTAEILCRTNNVTHIENDDKLYATSVSHWLQKLTELTAQTLIIVGHNPTFSQMLQYWCGYDHNMQPANCALITLEILSDGITYPASLLDFYHNE